MSSVLSLFFLYITSLVVVLATNSIEVVVQSIGVGATLREFSSNATNSVTLAQDVASFCRYLPSNRAECDSIVFDAYASQFPLQPIWTQTSTLLQHFATHVVEIECKTRLKNTFSSMLECTAEVSKAVRSAKVMEAFQASYILKDKVDVNTLVPLQSDWKEGIEGHTFYYIGKVRAMQDLADDPRVETVCEVGFNLGHSAISWLVANPTVKLLSFDVVRQLYTSAAINALDDMYPGRTVNLLAGDSTKSVPRFIRMFPQTKCNVIFIDGSHMYDGALLDMINLRGLANSSYHRIIIDDGTDVQVNAAWEETLRLGLARQVDSVQVEETTKCKKVVAVSAGPLAGSVEFFSCEPDPLEPNRHIQDSLYTVGNVYNRQWRQPNFYMGAILEVPNL